MHTAKDSIMRMMCGYTQKTPPEFSDHRYRIMATRGAVETPATRRERPKLWLADSQMHSMADVDWRYERTDAPPEALASGHRGTDYYVHTTFRDAVLNNKPPEIDVYKAVNTAAPAILAADSIRQSSIPIEVPDFRPNDSSLGGMTPDQFFDRAPAESAAA